MSFLKRAREMTGDVAAASKRQAQRGKLEVEVRRLESRMSGEKDAIGQAIYPLLEAGTLQLDLPEVQVHVSAIGTLEAEIAAKQAEIAALKSGTDDDVQPAILAQPTEAAIQETAHDEWAGEGGTIPEHSTPQ